MLVLQLLLLQQQLHVHIQLLVRQPGADIQVHNWLILLNLASEPAKSHSELKDLKGIAKVFTILLSFYFTNSGIFRKHLSTVPLLGLYP